MTILRSPARAALLFALLLPAASLATGCAHQPPPVSVDSLPLRRVVIYRNGVAYYERAGRVDVDRVRFRVRQNEVGDFLATMAVLEQGGSSVRSASFPLHVDDDDADETPDETQGAYRKIPQKKDDPNRLVSVSLDLDGKSHDLQVGYVAETPVWRPSYRLVIQDNGAADLQAWGIVENLTGEDWNDVTLALVAGAPLAFQPTLGEPIIPERPVVTDSGEVIAAMPQSETTLGRDVPPPPPPPPPADAAPPVAAPAGGATSETDDGADKDEAKTPGSAGPGGGKGKNKKKSPPRTATVSKAAMSEGGTGTRARGEEGAMGRPSHAPAPAAMEAISRPRNLASLAAVAVEGSSTRYDIPVKVTVPDKAATMVMLVATRVPGESVFLFAPAPGVPDSSSHPFRVARFTNQTSGLLERGPIAVFEKGAFLGEGMVDPLPPAATATVPFALERAIAIDSDLKTSEEGARVAHIEAAELTIERDYEYKTTYRVKNGRGDAVKLVVKHVRRNGTRLYQPPAGTEDNVGTGTALVPTQLGASASVDLVVDERMTMRRSVDWLDELANEAVVAYIADPRSDPTVRDQLKKAWEVRPALVKSFEEERHLRAEQSELERDTAETRENLKSIEKNPQASALRKTLTDRLAKSSARINEITKRLVEVRLSLDESRVRFNEAIRGIKMDKPLPPPT